MKAMDVFNASNLVFAEKVSFQKAFPSIQRISVSILEEGHGAHSFRSANRKRYLNADTLGEFVNCSNPLCYGGGFNIGDLIRGMVGKNETHKEKSFCCRGYEGSPKGRRKYRSCMNYFQVEAEIEYRGNDD